MLLTLFRMLEICAVVGFFYLVYYQTGPNSVKHLYYRTLRYLHLESYFYKKPILWKQILPIIFFNVLLVIICFFVCFVKIFPNGAMIIYSVAKHNLVLKKLQYSERWFQCTRLVLQLIGSSLILALILAVFYRYSREVMLGNLLLLSIVFLMHLNDLSTVWSNFRTLLLGWSTPLHQILQGTYYSGTSDQGSTLLSKQGLQGSTKDFGVIVRKPGGLSDEMDLTGPNLFGTPLTYPGSNHTSMAFNFYAPLIMILGISTTLSWTMIKTYTYTRRLNSLSLSERTLGTTATSNYDFWLSITYAIFGLAFLYGIMFGAAEVIFLAISNKSVLDYKIVSVQNAVKSPKKFYEPIYSSIVKSPYYLYTTFRMYFPLASLLNSLLFVEI